MANQNENRPELNLVANALGAICRSRRLRVQAEKAKLVAAKHAAKARSFVIHSKGKTPDGLSTPDA